MSKEKSELAKPSDNASRSLSSSNASVKFSPLLHSSFARLATQMARSSSDLEVQTIDEQFRIQRGSICSSTSNDCLSAAFLVQQQEQERQRHERQRRKTSRAGKTNQNSFSSRGSTASHVHSSASSSLVGNDMRMISNCRHCSQTYRCTCCPRW